MRQEINYGDFNNDEAADSIRTSFQKADDNFADLYDVICALTGDQNGQDVNTAQTWFPGGGVTSATLEADTSYLMDGLLALVRSAGTTSHTLSLLFAGTATLTSIAYAAESVSGSGNALQTVKGIRSDVASAVAVTAANTDADENIWVKINGVIRINAAGTVIPQFKYSAAPGGAPVVKANSFIRFQNFGSKTTVSVGDWS